MVFLFFFQAEDGIRDLVRSRGLGDVYKRQILFRSKLSGDMFQGLAPWVSRLPGRLLHVNVLGLSLIHI